MKRKKKAKVGPKSIGFTLVLLLIAAIGLPYLRDKLTSFEEISSGKDNTHTGWYWLDENYSLYRQTTVQNDDFKILNKDTFVEFEFDHKALVDQKKSNPQGSDLKMVYFTDKDYTDLDLRLSDTNTTNTKAYFKIASDIAVKSKDSSYYLYYANPNLSETVANTSIPTSTTIHHKITLQDEVETVFEVRIPKKWILKSNSLAREYTQLNVEILTNNIQVDIEDIDILIKSDSKEYKYIPTEKTPSLFRLTIDTQNIEPGEYNVSATIKDTSYKAEPKPINVSYPLFAVWSMDFEGFSLKKNYMNSMDNISSKYGVPITQLFNPRIFIADEISNSNKQEMVNWVLDRQKNNGDEIGLHMHMHLDMVAAAGLVPRQGPKWGTRANGHDVLTTAYTHDEFAQLVEWALYQFEENDLPKPITYRGGGWFIDEENIQALDEKGFKIETSGREAVIYGTNKEENPWDLTSTTYPYRISKEDQNRGDLEPKFNLWEFPNNGVNSTSYSGAEMIERFKDNYKGKPLTKAQTITFLSHPHWFDTYDKQPLEELFTHIESAKYENDNGPVVYTTLENAYKEWAY